jgi:hypothetical protein
VGGGGKAGRVMAKGGRWNCGRKDSLTKSKPTAFAAEPLGEALLACGCPLQASKPAEHFPDPETASTLRGLG